MKTAKSANRKKGIYPFIIPVISILLLIAIVIIVYNKYERNNNYRVLKITGSSPVSNISKGELFAFTGKSNDSSYYVLVENGDLIGAEEFLYVVTESTPDLISIYVKKDTAIYVNGKLNSIVINDTINNLKFLKSLTNDDIRCLSNISFQSMIPNDYIPVLKKIGSINKKVNLFFKNDDSCAIIKSYFQKANYFNPILFWGNIDSSLYPKLEKLTNITILFIAIKDSARIPLPHLPNLKSCIITDVSDEAYKITMMKNSSARFNLLMTPLFSNEELRRFTALPELAIHINDSAILKGLDEKIKHTSNLTIMIDSTQIIISPVLKKFTNVQWLRINGALSNDSMTKLLSNFRSTKVLEINGNHTLSNYKPVASLPNLYALIIRDTLTDYNSLASLKRLKYLSIPEEKYFDSGKLKSLEKALPGCILVPNSAACLGSSWLLLVPIISIGVFYFQYTRKNLQVKKLPL